MITEKSFLLKANGFTSNKIYKINNGLQQGTVTSPILFILFINDLLNIINNHEKNNFGIAFADDIIIYTANKNYHILQQDLQNLFNIVQNYILDWNLMINYEKCELILFRDTLSKCHNSVRKNWKQLSIQAVNQNIKIQHQMVFAPL